MAKTVATPRSSFANIALKADAFWQKLGRIFNLVSSGFMVLISITVVADVTGRYFFNKPIPGAVESLELMMPYVIYLGMAYTLAMGGHVRVTLVLGRISLRRRVWFEILTSAIAAFVLGVLVFQGWRMFWVSFMQREIMIAIVDLPWWVGKFAMPLGFFIFLIQFLLRLLVDLGRLANRIPLAKTIGEDKLIQTG